jgi:peptidyl-prolyl cis-trans isomerase SurA
MTVKNSLRMLAAGCIAAVFILGSATTLFAQNVVVMVNGEPITNYDIDQRSKLTHLSSRATPSRQQVLDELINEKVKIKEAKKFGIDPSAADIDAAFASMGSRMRMSADQLEKTLENQGIRPETLKRRIRAEMVWSNLVRGRFKSSLMVSEKEVQAAAGETEGQAGQNFEYQMQPVVLIVPRTAPAATREARVKEAEMLRGRVQSCADANQIFKAMQNAAIRSVVTKTSAEIPASLREILDKTPVGHLTAPEVTKQGVEMVALCSRKPSMADTPKKREIRDKMSAEKFEKKSNEYLQEARKAAMIEYR